MKNSNFIPMFPDEVKKRGWKEIDVLLVTGDPYVDHPAYGAAVIARVLESKGFKVGIIAQPDWKDLKDFTRLGRPRLCACVSAGNVDSMVANYTANKRKRKLEEGEGGFEGLRPDRASIVYSNRLQAAFKNLPIILGGIEASMRRLAHYDYWDNEVRRSILIDSKADMLIYGMAERQIVEVVNRLSKNEAIDSITDVRGTVVRVKKDKIPADAIFVPSFEEIKNCAEEFNKAFCLQYEEMNSNQGRSIVQPHADQLVLQLPKALPLTTKELDAVYALSYLRLWHPFYDSLGGVKGLETVRWSITALRGCRGECSFCGLSMHQGKVVQSRSEESILDEAQALTRHPDFRGTISDIGGPTANLYGSYCKISENNNIKCVRKKCLTPTKCPSLEIPHKKTLALYEKMRKIPKVKHVFISSGIRYDLLLEPEAEEYLKALCEHYISGQMKVAPEHTEGKALELMNKPSYKRYEEFVKKFERINAKSKNRKYLVNYFISAHPGCSLEDALNFALTLLSRNMRPEQIQDFIPLPMTLSSCLYYTGVHPFTKERVYVPKTFEERAMQRALIQSQNKSNLPLIKKALRILGKENLIGKFNN